MRRKDREKSRDFALKVVDASSFGVMTIKNTGYSVPLTFARDGNFLYFHGAKAGMKNDLLATNSEVRIVFVGENHLPDRVSDEEIKKDKKKISNLFTLKYESAIIEGKCELITEKCEKDHALASICKKFYDNVDSYIDSAIQMSGDITECYKIKIDTIEGKSNI